MKTLSCVTGLIGAMAILGAPVQLQAQWTSPTSEAAFGGPAEHHRIEANTWNETVVHRPSPYGFLWEGYCGEAAAYEMHRLHQFMARPGCDACGDSCGVEKGSSCADSPPMEYRHGRFVMQPRTVCEDCTYSSLGEDVPYESYPSEPAAPPEPDAPTPADAAETTAPQPIREPVHLTPVEDQPLTTTTERGPVIRLAPSPPTPADIRREQAGEERIPRNAIPSRP